MADSSKMADSGVSAIREATLASCSGDWSKAIKILNKSIEQHGESVSSLCARAMCYSQMELNKHAVKDCDKALALSSLAYQAYIRKGLALRALGKEAVAVATWRTGYNVALDHGADLDVCLQIHSLIDSSDSKTPPPPTNGSLPPGQPAGGAKTAALGANGGEPLAPRTPTREEAPAGGRAKKELPVSAGGAALTPNANLAVSGSSGRPLKALAVNGSGAAVANGVASEALPGMSSASIRGKEPAGSVAETGVGQAGKKAVATTAGGRAITSVSQGSRSTINIDLRLTLGIAHVNSGHYDQAIASFDKIIEDDPAAGGAYVGRGTALALQRKLEEAIVDFTKAIEICPTAAEAWKRRGQARAALGVTTEVITDFTETLKLQPDSPDVYQERGIAYSRVKDYHAAVSDLRLSVKMESDNKVAHNHLGLCLTALGNCKEGVKAYAKAVELDPEFKEAYTNMAQAYKDLGDSKNAVASFQKALDIDPKYFHAHRLLGLMRHGLGDHRSGLEQLTIALDLEPNNVECRYLRASCLHALGDFLSAVKEYDNILSLQADIESRTLQYLAFYQREVALYTCSRKTSRMCKVNIDGDLDPLFKEAWCKKSDPTLLLPGYKAQPLIWEFLKSKDFEKGKGRVAIIKAADKIGARIQYTCAGFLRNARQHRAAGIAIIEIAQIMSAHWQSLRDAKEAALASVTPTPVLGSGALLSYDELTPPPGGSARGGKGRKGRGRSSGGVSPTSGSSGSSNNRGGSASSSTSVDDEDEDEAAWNAPRGWRDLFSIAVRYRQMSEPCDPVVWVNMLSEKEFTAGFGSHTPMQLGQSRVMRYYPNFTRAFGIMKRLMLETSFVQNAGNEVIMLKDPEVRSKIEKAKDCPDLFELIGQDFWLVTPCRSSASSGKTLEGTRLTLQRSIVPPNGYDYSIRTPCTPARWADYDTELTSAWEALCEVMSSPPAEGSSEAARQAWRESVSQKIFRLGFYWYNFMPLSRGTAVVGYITMMGLFLSAGMEITASIPAGVQVDWEAILAPHPDVFMSAIRPWLMPSIKVVNPCAPTCESKDSQSSPKELPKVSQALPTVGSVFAALSWMEKDKEKAAK